MSEVPLYQVLRFTSVHVHVNSLGDLTGLTREYGHAAPLGPTVGFLLGTYEYPRGGARPELGFLMSEVPL